MKITAILEPSDITLLQREIPDNPCTVCGNRAFSCCGCNLRQDYERSIEPYKDAGVYKFATMLKKRQTLQQRIEDLKTELNVLEQAMPEAIKGIRLKQTEPDNQTIIKTAVSKIEFWG